MDDEFVTLACGAGGREMDALIDSFGLKFRGKWRNYENDSATLDIGGGKTLVFTTDSYIVDPIFFPGGDIGKLCVSGTINDLLVMGAKPLGISLGLVIEEGFLRKDLDSVISSIKRVSKMTGVPVVTGDTKVMERGKVDKIVINTAGVGIAADGELLDSRIVPGDKVILSGGLGEHAVALLSKRFDYETDVVSDSKPLVDEMDAVKGLLKIAKDPTRGGIAAALNEISRKNGVGILVYEDDVPVRGEVRKVVEMLGINLYELASEGRFVCVAASDDADLVVRRLKKFNKSACVIGEVTNGDKVAVQTCLGKRVMPCPTGRIVPRIC
ncbi:MAG: hydrogenase expression/formation protein HypE [archaeon]